MAAPQTYLYGLHEFIAENPDEVSFRVGETIIVIEKDDAYQDGWWQVRTAADPAAQCLLPSSFLQHCSRSHFTLPLPHRHT